jgi:hypothetical protein
MITLFFVAAPVALTVMIAGCLLLFSCFANLRAMETSVLWAPGASYVLATGAFLLMRPVTIKLPVIREEVLLGVSYAQALWLVVSLLILIGFRRILRLRHTRRLVIADAMVMVGLFTFIHSIGMIVALSDCVGYPETNPPCYMF